MHRIIFVFSLIIVSITASSQNFFGVTAGFTYSRIKGSQVADGVSIHYKPGYNVGLLSEVATIGDKFYLQLGTEIITKGYEAKDANYENLVTLGYIQIPVNVVGKLPLGSEGKNKFLFGAGTYIAFGVDFRTRLTDYNPVPGGEPVSINNGSFADYSARIVDLGLNVLTGVEIGNKIQATVFYQHGLTTVFYGDDLGNVQNRVAGLKISYNW